MPTDRAALVEEMLDAALAVRAKFVRQYGEGQMARTVLFDEMRAALAVAEREFARRVAEEREACAKVAEGLVRPETDADDAPPDMRVANLSLLRGYNRAFGQAATAIRARDAAGEG